MNIRLGGGGRVIARNTGAMGFDPAEYSVDCWPHLTLPNISRSRLPPKSNRFFGDPYATFPPKFVKKSVDYFCIILLTDKRMNEQSENNLVGGVNNVSAPVCWNSFRWSAEIYCNAGLQR